MHLLVTDRLACPRCGPEFGVVLMAERLEERRVLEGSLGCPNCRERYPVEKGFGDFRPTPRGKEAEGGAPTGDDPEGALRLGALLGIAEGPGLVLLTGTPVRHAERLSAMIEGIEVVAAHPGLREVSEIPGVTRISIPDRLPFFTGGLRGVVIEGAEGRDLTAEAVRTLGPGSRLVFFDPPAGAEREMEALGLDLLLEAESVLVGARK